jgi:hypothetical protein
MSIEKSIAHHGHGVGIGITAIKKRLDRVRPVHCGTLYGDVDRPPPRQGLGKQKHIGRTDPCVCVIVPLWLARRGWQWRTRFFDELHRLFVHMDQRVSWILGARLEIQDILHRGHKVRIVLWGNHPTLV